MVLIKVSFLIMHYKKESHTTNVFRACLLPHSRGACVCVTFELVKLPVCKPSNNFFKLN